MTEPLLELDHVVTYYGQIRILEKIIAARPFKMKSQLVSKGIVTKAEYSKLAAHVIAKSEKSEAKK